MGHSGEKIQLIGPSVTWEDHFQTLREAVEGTTGGEAGSPVAVHLLAQLRDLVKVIPFMLELEETRLDFLAPSVGDEFSFIQFRHVPWDWETMSPALERNPVTPEESGTDEDGNEWDARGPKPCSDLEAVTLAAISKGLGWYGKDGVRTPVLLKGLKGLSAFPEESPSPIPEGLRHEWKTVDMDLSESILKGLGRDREAILNSVMTHGPILPWSMAIGGEHDLARPSGFPFDPDLQELLQVDSEVWRALRFRGEAKGHKWESYFALTCRGLVVNEDLHEAGFLLEVVPRWWAGEVFRKATSPAPSVNPFEGLMAMKDAVLEWGPAEWTAWAQTITEAIEEAMTILGWERSVTAPPPVTYEVETVTRPLTFPTGEGFLSDRGGQQIKFLNKPTPDPSKVKSLEKEWDAKIQQGELIRETTGELPDWLEENPRRGEGPYRLKKAEMTRIREELGRSPHGVAEMGRGFEPRWVRIGEDNKGRRWEFHLGGQWRFLNEAQRIKTFKALEAEDEYLANREVDLGEESRGSLFPPEEEFKRLRAKRTVNQARRDALTSWGRAIKLLAFCRGQFSIQRQETVEVDADTFLLVLWGAEEPPDNWLATIRETLGMLVDISATVLGITAGAGASLISWEYRTKTAPEKGQDAAKGALGSNIVFFVTLNRALIGGLAFLESGTRTLPHGTITATFDTSKKNRRAKEKAIDESGDRLHHSPEVLLHHFLEVLGEPLEVQKLAQTLCDHTTGATAAVLKGWTSKPKGEKNPDGSGERQYTSRFNGCHILPAPGAGFLHGALGSFRPTPECGWSLRGRHNETRRTNYSLLEFMEIDVPPGGAEAKRQEAYRKGFKALLRVVVELGGGVLAVNCAGKWHDLGQPMEEAKAIYLLTTGRIYPFFRPGWIDRIRTAYELKVGGALPKTAEEATAARWKKPVTDEEGFTLAVQIKATMERRGLTQVQAAADLGVSQKTVSTWIKGSPVSPESSAKIAEWMSRDKSE